MGKQYKDLQSANLKLLARLLSMWTYNSYLKLFPGLYPSLFWYKMLRRQDFHGRSSILYSYSLVDDLEKTSKFQIFPLRKGIDSIVFLTQTTIRFCFYESLSGLGRISKIQRNNQLPLSKRIISVCLYVILGNLFLNIQTQWILKCRYSLKMTPVFTGYCEEGFSLLITRGNTPVWACSGCCNNIPQAG